MKLSLALFLMTASGAAAFETSFGDKTIGDQETCEADFPNGDPGGKPGEYSTGMFGSRGIHDDNCVYYPLTADSDPMHYSEAEVPTARGQQAANSDNPASFCGRPMDNPGYFDPYYLGSGPSGAVAFRAAPPPIQYMEIAFPGQTVTVTDPDTGISTTGVLQSDCTVLADPSASGDPHFSTWGGDRFDFHGGCHLVLLKNENFANGRGLNVFIRTHIKTWWSYIDAAVLQIGDNHLEVSGAEGGWVWFNGDKEGHKLESGAAALGDYAISTRRVNDHQTKTRIDLGNGNAVGIETFKDFVRVNVHPKHQESFHGSAGLLGAFPSGKKVGRDGTTVFEDTNAFGQEWMLSPSEPMLFHADVESERPLQCAMPSQEAKKESRRLGEAAISEEEAALACARVNETDRNLCIFDVLATNDKDMAGSY